MLSNIHHSIVAGSTVQFNHFQLEFVILLTAGDGALSASRNREQKSSLPQGKRANLNQQHRPPECAAMLYGDRAGVKAK
jgi:hypothetical protein